jgi:methionyl aminopeptidase
VTTDEDGWTVRAADRLPSAHYEHMVVVQDGDAEVLSDYQYIEDVIEPPYKINALKETTTP